MDDSSSPCASTSACQSSSAFRRAGIGAEGLQHAQAFTEHGVGIEVEFGAERAMTFDQRRNALGDAVVGPIGAFAIACSSLVTPDSAETTTSTRAPSSAMRFEARRPMVSQRLRRDTEVPPNLSTTQGNAPAVTDVCPFAEVEELQIRNRNVRRGRPGL